MDFLKKDIRKFIYRLTLFVLPFLAALLLELFILPIDFFTFRVWESLKITNLVPIMYGEFYPNMRIEKKEVGDLSQSSGIAVEKNVVWETDQYGYRKKNTDKAQEIVIIGESTIAGCSISQQDMLSEVLQADLNKETYPFAPSTLGSFLLDQRFIKTPPKLVIIGVFDYNLLLFDHINMNNTGGKAKIIKKVKESINHSNETNSLVSIFLDRSGKMIIYQGMKSKILQENGIPTTVIDSMVFLNEKTEVVSDEEIEYIISIIQEYKQLLNDRGIKFLLLPIPSKTNIYHKYFPKNTNHLFLQKLITNLKKNDIDVVDIQSVFDSAYNKNIRLYHQDDTHWNPLAIRMAAKEIEKKLTEKPELLIHN